MALSELRAVVVIPARDEEAEIAGCLQSLAVQTLPRAWFETVLVLDRCQDATADVALAVARRLGLVLHATSTSGPAPGRRAVTECGSRPTCCRPPAGPTA